MLTLLMTVGSMGSGKTSFLDLVNPDPLFCPDNNLMTNQIYRWTAADAARAWSTEYCRFGHMLSIVDAEQTQLWAWDATFPTRISRSAVLSIAKGYGMRVVALYFKTPLDICLGRNAQRSADRRVPEEKLRAFAARLEVPRVEEGFDMVLEVLPGDRQTAERVRKWK